MKMCFRITDVVNQHPIAGDTDGSFLFLIKLAVLMALREQGNMTEMQLRHAEELLHRQCRDVTGSGFCKAGRYD